MKKRTYKQWVDFHYNNLKKQYPDRPDTVLKMMAGDAAKKSIELQGMTERAAAISEPVLTPRVGPGAPTIPVPKPTETATPAPVPTVIQKRPAALAPAPTPTAAGQSAPMSYNDKLKARIKATGAIDVGPFTTTGAALLDWVDFVPTIDDREYVRIQAALKGLGYNVKNKFQINEVLSKEFANLFPVRTVDGLINELNKFKLPGGGEEAKLPLRQIPALDRGVLVSFARSIVEDTLMMERLSPEMENKIVDDWMKKAEKGTVTMPTKKVRNPKTGKLENVVETKRAFDQQAEGVALADRLKQMFPDQYELAQGIGFAAEMKKILAGGM